ncbi:hypothetical protein A8F94_12440 [Bacillus sp. FJAT-27225]|uniref:CBO0543 family protein n=1 Tax=Bacillus sp. FJAT-27225 TaxID=1743144 RepID=UPI00080C236F|nr:CBO0543 family protein [Bacillus sp. FJAT-27225]OCA85678.1 hypothetical protein A8F94_12440 [Bacillus sp. FJAT-27225]
MEERIIIIILFIAGVTGILLISRNNWKRYFFLYLISAISGLLICYAFVAIRLYSFPDIPFHDGLAMPVGIIVTVFPFLVLFGVFYSPEKWIWKIPFYWTIVHLGIAGEVFLKQTSLFRFSTEWDLWDSYTLWWLYLILFDLLGGKIIPRENRLPIPDDAFRYGKWGWIVSHVILISTIFLAGVYTGAALFR